MIGPNEAGPRQKRFTRAPNPWSCLQHSLAVEKASAIGEAVSAPAAGDANDNSEVAGEYALLDGDAVSGLKSHCTIAGLARQNPTHVGGSFDPSVKDSRRAVAASRMAAV